MMDERFQEALKNLWRAALSTSPKDAMGGEWTVPVRPSDLKLVLECIENDVPESSKGRTQSFEVCDLGSNPSSGSS